MGSQTFAMTLVVLGILAGAIVLMVRIVGTGRRVKAAWTAFGASLGGLRVEEGREGRPRLVGTYRGTGVDVALIVLGVQENRTFYTRIDVDCAAPLPDGLGLRRQGLLARLETLAEGAREIQIGVPDFDRKFVIEGGDEPGVRRLLAHAGRREALVACLAREPELAVLQGHVQVLRRGAMTRHDALRASLDAAVDAARALES